MTPSTPPTGRDIPPLIWIILPPTAILAAFAAALFGWDQILAALINRDEQGGILEWGTVIVLLPALAAGASILLFHREKLGDKRIVAWVCLWSLAIFYFAGEEASWGQWLFGWETPEELRAVNDQAETNLHNMSSWLDQKPRALVEIFVLIGGLILPIWRRMRAQPLKPGGFWYWVLPSHVGTVTVACWATAQISDWIGGPVLTPVGSSELREYYIAVFLALFMCSIWSRARTTR